MPAGADLAGVFVCREGGSNAVLQPLSRTAAVTLQRLSKISMRENHARRIATKNEIGNFCRVAILPKLDKENPASDPVTV